MPAHDLDQLPYQTTVLPHVWIPLPDGSRLAARLWLPVTAGPAARVPAILEYHPYRKNDHTFAADEQQHRYFAGHGYACARVDLRGSGDSDGVLGDEYTPQEQADGVAVIEWLAAQVWCTGSVGMIGRSWGGFNGLQIAAHRPEPLKAIITIASTDDRYAEDVHYSGGCLIASEMLPWANRMLAYNAQPPDPNVVGEHWRRQWFERMEQAPPFIEEWIKHQHRDEYWKQGSVCEDYAAIECAVYAVGGWADSYRNAVLRLLENLSAPRKGLIGPWAHITPYAGSPGPLIGFLQESLRWWDHWLRGIDTGVMAEPMLRAWVADPVAPENQASTRPGHWVAESTWPPADTHEQRWYPQSTSVLDKAVPVPSSADIVGMQHTGVDGGAWLSYGTPDHFAPDQRAEDGRATTYTSEPLTERVEILGRPQMALRLSASQPVALVSVRLCDVAPDGASLLVTKGLLNLTHRESHQDPTYLDSGTTYDVTVPLDAVGHAFAEAHRVRISVSPTSWPGAWPSPAAVRLRLDTGPDSYLTLPVRPPAAADRELTPFEEPEAAPAPPTDVDCAGFWRRSHTHGVGTGRHEISWRLDPCARQRVNDITIEEHAADRFEIVEGAPLSARVDSVWDIGIARGEWDTRVVSTSTMTSDETTFHINCSLEGFDSDRRVFVKSWTFDVPRDHG